MKKEIKTLHSWYSFAECTGKTSIYDYLKINDLVSEDIINHFQNVLPPRTMTDHCLQMGEPYNYAYDSNHQLKPTYMTFAKNDGQWKFCGNCVAGETIDRTKYEAN